MRRIAFIPVLLSLFSAGSLLARPIIEFDTKEFDGGSFVEGTKDKIEAVFTIKNTGDDTLRLTSVKPSCGCTVVKFDSLIVPGQSTKINATVNIRGKKGYLSKSIAVLSNAENDSNTRLIIKATIREAISSSVATIDMTGDDQHAKFSLQLVSSKNDLKISDVSFVPGVVGKNADGTPIKIDPIKVTFSLSTIDTTRTDGMTGYRLELDPVTAGAPSSGEFVITTNHPDKKELRIKGKTAK